MSKISIIIPVYNTKEILLKRCIDSILSQTFTDFEVILVNDCSTDNCPKICEDYAKKDSRIKIIHNQQNMGCPRSREIGLKEAKGEYIQFSDSDDWMEENMLEEMYNTLIINNSDMVCCDYCKYYEENNHFEKTQEEDIIDAVSAIKDVFSGKVWGVVWNKLTKKSILEQVIFPYYSFDFASDDTVITIQLLFHAQTITQVKKPLYHYYINPHLHNIKENVESVKNYTQIIEFLSEKYGDLSIFEPELSYRVNLSKSWLLQHKYAEIRAVLKDFYPESNKRIFSISQFYLNEFEKFRLFCAVYHMPFWLFRIYLKGKRFLRKIRKINFK
jgi:glycosyltransferase involved in cell wall biosynthesis